MSDLKAQEFYQLYRKKTIEAGYTPIGRQRFTGIIKTLSLIPETFNYLQNKANGDSYNHEKALPTNSVVGQSEQLKAEGRKEATEEIRRWLIEMDYEGLAESL